MSDLSTAFGTPARAQLGGLLAKRSGSEAPAAAPPATTAAPAAEPVDDVDADAIDRGEAPADAPAPVRRAEPASAPAAAVAVVGEAGTDLVTTTQVSVYLTPDAIAAVRRARAGGRRTNADVALDAIDSTVDRLPTLLSARRTGPDRPNSLFPARPRPTRAAGDGPRRALWSMKATAAELTVIDRLVGQLGAASRSELIATAIEASLTRPRRRRG